MGRGKRQEQIAKEILLTHANALFYIACKLTRDRTTAEDLVQETYLKAYRALAQLKRSDAGKAWLFRILLNTWGNWKVKMQREPLLMDQDRLTLQRDRAARSHPWFLPISPEETLLKQEMLQELDAALQGLPEALRLTILLVDVQGLSYRESARILDIPYGTVMSRLYRARRMLEQFFGDPAGKSEEEGHGRAGV